MRLFLGRNVGGEPSAVATGEGFAERVADVFAQWHGQIVEGVAVDKVTAAVLKRRPLRRNVFND